MINHCLFVRREAKPGKEITCGSCASRLAKSLVCVSILLGSAGAMADDTPLPTQIVNLANKVDGVHPGYRAFHAKGVVVEGTFKASAEAAKLSPDYLFDDLAKRLAQKPVVFHLKAQLAEPGGQTKDASQPWPDDRKVVAAVSMGLIGYFMSNRGIFFFVVAVTIPTLWALARIEAIDTQWHG
jgi:hypothetical protein